MNDGAVPNSEIVDGQSRKTVALVVAGLFLVVVVISASFAAYQLGKTGGSKSGQVRVRSTAFPSAVPSPTPLLGPGSYACDPFGVCNLYDESARAGCPKTFADRSCLNECEKKDVRCKK